jgi:hypothetical protein
MNAFVSKDMQCYHHDSICLDLKIHRKKVRIHHSVDGMFP